MWGVLKQGRSSRNDTKEDRFMFLILSGCKMANLDRNLSIQGSGVVLCPRWEAFRWMAFTRTPKTAPDQCFCIFLEVILQLSLGDSIAR